jgi:signal transduction histidine kinase/ActR/RegA family two-component response regulator
MIGGWLARRASFGAKVIALLTWTGGLAVLLVSVGVVVVAYFDLRNEAISSVESRSRIVAMNSGAPLAFDDRQNAYEALAALQGSPHVARATVFTLAGEPFAHFVRERDAAPELPLDDQLGLAERGSWLVYTRPVEEIGKPLGFVQVVFDLDHLNSRIASLFVVVMVIAVGAMLLIHVFARRIGGQLVQPVAELSRTAREISQTRNFDLRATVASADEIGQLTGAFNHMLDELQEQHGELQAARRDAERASRSKDEFLATLSHELRTPMTPILGWAQILLRAAHDPERVRQGAEIIERNARIQTRIIDDLLDMSRIVSGKMVLRVEEVDLSEVVHAALGTVQPAAEARGVSIDLQLDPSVPAVRGDPNRLQQILWNLLSNAIKFTGRGGRVRVQLTRPDAARVRLSVADDGQGMAAELLPHVFERFRQADSSTTRAQGGLGLGLAIVRQLVEQHGGTVEAASAGVGRGATFTVDLPLPPTAADRDSESPNAPGHARAARAIAAREDDQARTLAGVRVILVEDDADARDLLAHVLAEAGAQVEVAGSAAQALELLERAAGDVLISDIGMPGVDGYELIRTLRNRSASRGGRIPAIAVTAFARDEDRQHALEAGFEQHVGKPVDPEHLVASVAALYRTGRERR